MQRTLTSFKNCLEARKGHRDCLVKQIYWSAQLGLESGEGKTVLQGRCLAPRLDGDWKSFPLFSERENAPLTYPCVVPTSKVPPDLTSLDDCGV